MQNCHKFLRRRWFHKRQKIASVCSITLMMMFTGCRETNRQVFKRYENQFAEKRQQFKAIAQTLPSPGSVKGVIHASLSPLPIYNPKTNSYNTEIVMYDQLLDPDIRPDDQNRLDLLLSGDLLVCMKWTGPNNPMAESVLSESAGDREQTLKKALGMRYLVVHRPVKFLAPVAVNEDTYKPGVADVEGFVIDMKSSEVAASYRFTAQSAHKVEYQYKSGESREGRLESFAYSSLYNDAREKAAHLLGQATGGQFVLEK